MASQQPLASYRQTDGNLSILVLVDSRQPEFGFQFEATFAALAHFGVPFRILDLGHAALSEEMLRDCRAVLIGQEYLAESIGSDGVRLLLEAVHGGLGLVNEDFRIADGYGPAYVEALGVEGIGPSGKLMTGSTGAINVRPSDHAITWLQDGGLHHQLKAPVPTTLTHGAAPSVLLEGDEGEPQMLSIAFGQGRIVQWLVSPRIWLYRFLGHAAGLDDVWLRSILWASRKPVVIKAMPLLFRFRFDDCQGLWRNAEDLAFVDVLNERGHVSSLSYCLRALTPDGATKVHSLYESRKADFSPHVLEPMQSLFYGDSHGEYSEAQFAEMFQAIDDSVARLGIRASRVLSDHDHSTSTRALPFLRARGMVNKMNVCLPGETWPGLHVDWHPAPYGSMAYAFDFLPSPAQDFFVVFNHSRRAFDASRAYLDPNHFVFHRDGGFGSERWDMLAGLTKGDGWGENQLDRISQRLADHTRSGLDAGFFGGSITHSHFIRHLTASEWREVLARADALMPRHRYEPASYDFIAEYARSKVNTAMTQANEGRGNISVELVGEATVPIRLAAYRDPELGEPAQLVTEAFSKSWSGVF
jgi:hypothetical protein